MLRALCNYFDQTPIRPFLGDLLITGLSKLLHNEPVTFSNFPTLYNSIFFRQTRIGWKQLFLGQFVLEWSNIQQNHLVLQNITSKKYSGTSWITGITQIIWHYLYSNCEAVNADLHGIHATMREQAQYAQAQRETEKIYSPRSLVKPCDREVFHSNNNEHFQEESTARGLKQCLNTWKPLILRSIQEGTATGTNQNHSICDFFHPLATA